MKRISNGLARFVLPAFLLTAGLAYGGQEHKMQHGMMGEGRGMMAECPMMEGQGMPPGKGMMMKEGQMDRLGLSEEQRARMHEIHQSHREELMRMRDAMHDVLTEEQREQLRQMQQQESSAPVEEDDDHDQHH